MYPRHFERPPISIQWGKDNEHRASQEYLKYAKSHGKKNLSIRKCGFLIHPVMGWLGASPDARVTDLYSDLPEGIAEFKCPFSKKDLTLIEACEDPSFYCHYEDGFYLKRNYPYYHQVQLQLFVGMDKYSWCDFVVYTTKGIAAERISLVV